MLGYHLAFCIACGLVIAAAAGLLRPQPVRCRRLSLKRARGVKAALAWDTKTS